jgi:high frequency lysogenization protein
VKRLGRLQDRVLALSGVFQAARLVQQLSRRGRADAQPFRASVQSILMIDATDTAAVYGGPGGVSLGLQLLHDKLGGSAGRSDLEMAKYVIAMLQLEAALRRRPEVAEAIGRGIETIESQMRFFEATEDETAHPRLVEKLGELYTRTLSTLTPRIMVTGEQGYLANPQIAASVRAALFAGIRSAVLWRQLGGNRWQLLLSRRRLAAEAAAQLAALHSH